jgi:ketosteroid isomerase-like protein
MHTPGKFFYDAQIAALEAKDLDAIVSNYQDDAEIIGFDVNVKGHDAIQKHFESYLERLGTITLKSTDKFVETDNAIFFEATMLIAQGEARVYDVFILKDGKAIQHFTGVISLTPLSEGV